MASRPPSPHTTLPRHPSPRPPLTHPALRGAAGSELDLPAAASPPARTSVLLSAALSTAIFCQGSASCARGIFPARLPQLRAPLSRSPGGGAGAARQTTSPRGNGGTARPAKNDSGRSGGDCCPLPPSLLPPPSRCQAGPCFRPPTGPPFGHSFRSQHGAGTYLPAQRRLRAAAGWERRCSPVAELQGEREVSGVLLGS